METQVALMIEKFLSTIYRPAFAVTYNLLPKRVPWSAAAHQMLLTIAGQESGWTHRRQMGGGPARGFWQFEVGGVRGVMTHRATGGAAGKLYWELDLGGPYVAEVVHVDLEHNEALALGFARLLLFSDPAPLPSDAAEGWDYYLRNWRPGRPHPDAWPKHWDAVARVLEREVV